MEIYFFLTPGGYKIVLHTQQTREDDDRRACVQRAMAKHALSKKYVFIFPVVSQPSASGRQCVTQIG